MLAALIPKGGEQLTGESKQAQTRRGVIAETGQTLN